MTSKKATYSDVERMWNQKMDTVAMAKIIKCHEADAERELNRVIDAKWRKKNGR